MPIRAISRSLRRAGRHVRRLGRPQATMRALGRLERRVEGIPVRRIHAQKKLMVSDVIGAGPQLRRVKRYGAPYRALQTARNIGPRARQAWRSTNPIDRLVIGSVATSLGTRIAFARAHTKEMKKRRARAAARRRAKAKATQPKTTTRRTKKKG